MVKPANKWSSAFVNFKAFLPKLSFAFIAVFASVFSILSMITVSPLVDSVPLFSISKVKPFVNCSLEGTTALTCATSFALNVKLSIAIIVSVFDPLNLNKPNQALPVVGIFVPGKEKLAS